MASYCKIRFLRNVLYRNNFTRTKQFGTKFKVHPKNGDIKPDVSNLQENIASELKNKIIYSSYIDQQHLNLGYVKNKVYLDSIEKQKKRKILESAKARPFPITLKYLKEGEQLDNHQSSEQKQDYDIIPNLENQSMKNYPENWMQDYEFYNEDNEESTSINGTPDPTVPPSKVPCSGCGALLHCADSGIPGYIPSEIFKDRTKDELKRIICQRCHFLKMYNVALDVHVTPEMYIETISTIQDKFALAILIVDLLDFPCSIWPGIHDLLGSKRPVFVVGNKVDLLPKDSPGYLDYIKNVLTHTIVESGLTKMNLKHVCLISAKTGYGVEELITQLHKIWGYNGDVYLVGCTNVGKSSLFNALLRSDYCKVQASELVQRATTCIWPGTTLKLLKFPILRPSDYRIYQRFLRIFSERGKKAAELKLRRDQLRETRNVEYATLIGHVGQTFKKSYEEESFSMPKGVKPILTLNEQDRDLVGSKWCYDTPGVMHQDQVHHLLTTKELLMTIPRKMIVPRVFRIKPEMSLFLAGLARFDFTSGNCEAIRVSIYASLSLPILITKINDADEMYDKLLGTEYLAVPEGDEERLKQFPKLEPSQYYEVEGESNEKATCDFTLSSSGWIGVSIPSGKMCTFQIWTPEKRGIHMRKPPLIPYGEKLRGSKIRGSLAYKIRKPFIV